MNLRVSAKTSTLREAAWGLEENLFWRGSDAAQRALDQARRSTAPLQRLIETRLVWPLADALRKRSAAAQAGIATAAVATAVAAGGAGAIVAPDQHPPQPDAAASLASATASAAASVPVLKGATPNFEVGDAKVAPPAAPAELPSAPPAKVAWQFADAFVRYEVGRLDKRTAAAFAATATPPLAKSLGEEPPRLPAGTTVPKAKVLNVVLGDRTPKQVTASVSIIRLRTLSEVRLTLQRTKSGWRVAGVLA